MTESEWNNSTDPQEMLTFLRESGRLTDRKARLFAVACCRTLWAFLPDEGPRRFVGEAEEYADGLAGERELEACRVALEAWEELQWAHDPADRICRPINTGNPVEAAAVAVRLAVSRSTLFPEGLALFVWTARGGEKQPRQLLRDLFGNTFRPAALDPSCLAWNNGTIPRLAQAAYEERQLPRDHLDPTRLAVLADALEEAGCSDLHLLEHLRGPGPHYRGCWPLDLLLGKS